MVWRVLQPTGDDSGGAHPALGGHASTNSAWDMPCVAPDVSFGFYNVGLTSSIISSNAFGNWLGRLEQDVAKAFGQLGLQALFLCEFGNVVRDKNNNMVVQTKNRMQPNVKIGNTKRNTNDPRGSWHT